MAMGHPQQVPHPQYMAAGQPRMPPVNEAAIRRSRKPTDKNIPDDIEDLVIGDGVQEYKKLRELEKRLDSSMVRKRLDIQDSLSRTVKRYRTLRIWISNTVEGQPWQKGEQNEEPQADPANPGSGRYKVRIEGKLLDDYTDPTVPADDSDDEEEKDADAMQEDDQNAGGSKQSKQQRSRQRLSHFFKSITVDFDKTPNLKKVEDVSPIIWEKPQVPPNATAVPENAEFDSIQFSRGAQENVNITVSLIRDEAPERFRLNKDLAEILDVQEESRSGVILGVWDYIRAMGLQEDHEKRQVRCDHRLRKVFRTLHYSFKVCID
jgi:SWI/SNF-related matrix-associated actin-dependent regulator of chromatin subfamily D